MWIIAGVLLGVVVLASLAGLHTGPHAHLVAGVAGVAAAVWLVVMLAMGGSGTLLWGLLVADLVVAVGVGWTAWRALTAPPVSVHHEVLSTHGLSLESAEGIAVGDLDPEGIVRVRGEQWSAVSMNGTVRSGEPVQVLRAEGVRLEVWGEFGESLPTEGLFRLEPVSLDGTDIGLTGGDRGLGLGA
jgi:membrane-bound ClpP family serine protease